MGHYVDAVWQSRFERDPQPVPYRAWVPEPIAELDLRLTGAQGDAARSLESQIRDFCSSATLGSCDWFLRSAEGSASTSIEDIYPSPRRLLRTQFAGKGRDAELSALANMAAIGRALEVGSNARDLGGLTADDIRSIHASLASRLPDYEHECQHAPGEFRRWQNWIDAGGGRGRLSDADRGPTAPSVEFVAPRPEDVERLMQDLVEFCNRTDLPAIPKTAVAHARFEEIHPFPDGNGRTGRALVHAMWSQQGAVTGGVTIPVSSALAPRKDAYVAALQAFHSEHPLATSANTALDPIMNVFLAATSESIDKARRIESLMTARVEGWKHDLKARRRSLTHRVLTNLGLHPALDRQMLVDRYEVTDEQADAVIRRLTGAGVLVRRNAGPGIWCYEAPALVDDLKSTFRQIFNPDDAGDDPEPLPPTGRLTDEWTGTLEHDQGWLSESSRRECGELMPLARKRCVLAAGHAGPHRSVKPWAKKN